MDQGFRLRVVGIGLFACGVITLLSLGFHAKTWLEVRAFSDEQFTAALPTLQAQSFKIALWSMLVFYLTVRAVLRDEGAVVGERRAHRATAHQR